MFISTEVSSNRSFILEATNNLAHTTRMEAATRPEKAKLLEHSSETMNATTARPSRVASKDVEQRAAATSSPAMPIIVPEAAALPDQLLHRLKDRRILASASKRAHDGAENFC